MKNNILLFIFISLLSYLFYLSKEFIVVGAGVAIFMIGMYFLENGFKKFSGGALEIFLEKSTDKIPKAIFTGFLSTAIVQSSSLISVITISFLSVGLIKLGSAIGIIFGSNIGTTATSWIVAYFGIKIKISVYAMPMIIFGLIFRFNKNRKYQGFGNILLGLGFIFLGIGYMKEGFEVLKNSIDLAKFAVTGYKGIFLYILIGIFATIIIQSSSATMAIAITALSTTQISYENALAIAIGANVGTTITAILASLTSNSDGKRLALAHLIFNFITAFIATILIYKFIDLVNFIATLFDINSDNYVIKLAIFHTLFNLVGVLILSPFINLLTKELNRLFKGKDEVLKPIYLPKDSTNISEIDIKVIEKEIVRVYQESIKLILKTFNLDENILKNSHYRESNNKRYNEFDFDKEYNNNIKSLVGEILLFITKAQSEGGNRELGKYRISLEYLLSAVKDTKHIKKNMSYFLLSKNSIQKEYAKMQKSIEEIIIDLESIKDNPNDISNLSKIELLKEDNGKLSTIFSKRIDNLIRNNQIDKSIAISFMNDTNYFKSIIENLVTFAEIIWVREEMKQLKMEEEIENS